MRVQGRPYRTVWSEPDRGVVRIIDQRQLPWSFVLQDLATVADVVSAISDMAVRGAGCIGATAGYGMWLATRQAERSEQRLREFARLLIAHPVDGSLRD